MIRMAEKKDTKELCELIWIVLKDMELPILKELPEKQLKRLMQEAMLDEDYRYSYRRGIVCIRNNQIAGVSYGYKGELEPFIDQPLTKIMGELYLENSLLFTDEETQSGEWYLDILVTEPTFRRQGVAVELLSALPDFAEEQNEPIIGLNCDEENGPAKQLYEKMGYQKIGERVISGHRYHYMQYTLK
ncbi:GNAT family N-acetyltransferase [Carnobacterium funditum]|uniref:GNAT family N-acetyltransferase n=1 Tax=Carnobacterium funditum TaxID=2752 RepID=UPI0005539A45|nr:GNAT family N-acetyltransferase [Carnobacterium funditum]